MQHLFIILLVSLFLTVSAVAQEDESESDEIPVSQEDAEGEAEEVVAAEEPEDEIDETGLDEQGFRNEDNDFRPSEDIPADQSIPFPTDI